MKPAAEDEEHRRQTRGCAASMPLWHVNGEGRMEMQESGSVCVQAGRGASSMVVFWLTKS